MKIERNTRIFTGGEEVMVHINCYSYPKEELEKLRIKIRENGAKEAAEKSTWRLYDFLELIYHEVLANALKDSLDGSMISISEEFHPKHFRLISLNETNADKFKGVEFYTDDGKEYVKLGGLEDGKTPFDVDGKHLGVWMIQEFGVEIRHRLTTLDPSVVRIQTEALCKFDRLIQILDEREPNKRIPA